MSENASSQEKAEPSLSHTDSLHESSSLGSYGRRQRTKWDILYEEGLVKEMERTTRQAEDEMRKIDEELAELRPVPHISPGARNQRPKDVSFADYNLTWQREREKRLQERRDARMEEERSALLDRPLISRTSLEIAHHLTRKNVQKDWEVHALDYKQRKQGQEEVLSFRPSITAEAESLVRDEPVFERLHRLATEHQMNLSAAADAAKSEVSFSPHTNEGPVPFASLLRAQMMYEEGKDRLRKVRESDIPLDNECTFHPAIAPRTEKILSKSNRKPVHVACHSPRKEQPSSSPREKSQDTRKDPRRFKAPSRAFLERQERTLRAKTEASLIHPPGTTDNEISECTFSPKLCRRSLELAQQRERRDDSLNSSPVSPLEKLYERAVRDRTVRDQELDRVRMNESDSQLRNLSFSPRILHVAKESTPSPSSRTPRSYSGSETLHESPHSKFTVSPMDPTLISTHHRDHVNELSLEDMLTDVGSTFSTRMSFNRSPRSTITPMLSEGSNLSPRAELNHSSHARGYSSHDVSSPSSDRNTTGNGSRASLYQSTLFQGDLSAPYGGINSEEDADRPPENSTESRPPCSSDSHAQSPDHVESSISRIREFLSSRGRRPLSSESRSSPISNHFSSPNEVPLSSSLLSVNEDTVDADGVRNLSTYLNSVLHRLQDR